MNINVYGGDVYVNSEDKEIIEKTVSKTQDIRKNVSVNVAKKNVKKRDGCCQVCGEMDKPLEIHHIMPLAKYPSLASDEHNLITLCQKHHKEYHELYKDSEGADTFSKYLIDNHRRF